MKPRWLCVVAAVILASALLVAQQPAAEPPAIDSANPLNYEDGLIANGIYSNQCFGFSLPIPSGFEVNEAVTPGGKATHRSGKSLVLLLLHQRGKRPGGIILGARDATGQGTARDFVANAVHTPISSATEHREVIQDTFAVDYGGRHFFRADYGTSSNEGTSLYFAYVYTEFRGYLIGETLAASSEEALDEAASLLHGISFQDDQINPKCAMGPDEAAISPVHIAKEMSAGLVVKKVPPDYPELARQTRIQGQVVLRVLIDKQGNIADLTLVSGHPMLAPAAIKAVKQWKYKPYMVNGQPVAVETQVVVNFSLIGG